MKTARKRFKNHDRAAPRRSPWLTPEELAARIHYGVGTLANWRSQGKGPKSQRMAKTGKVRYHIRDVLKWEGKRR